MFQAQGTNKKLKKQHQLPFPLL